MIFVLYKYYLKKNEIDSLTQRVNPPVKPKKRPGLTDEQLSRYPLLNLCQYLSIFGSQKNETFMENFLLKQVHARNIEFEPSLNINPAQQLKKLESNLQLEISNSLNARSNVSYSDFECLICFEEICSNQDVRNIPCSHLFHATCLDQWLTTRSVFCPACRFDLSA
ncbi:Receptor homology region, transmembrane domain- and RING domain-containing protein 2 [Smittium culicis]|uniref:RING-type E3 ubiquitin transferase n=1 Tax=Smittium culicis TaxID=133412 RepID=A0A1R1YTK0_9FUNG|nr:Receptor homology region, transmembrane domain- and RING domain-containing protein 2 [Smittium culicis]